MFEKSSALLYGSSAHDIQVRRTYELSPNLPSVPGGSGVRLTRTFAELAELHVEHHYEINPLAVALFNASLMVDFPLPICAAISACFVTPEL